MIVSYFRSSSYNTWDMCPASYLFGYVLPYRSKSNIKAAMGSVVHKSLELIAKKKLAMQRGEHSFADDELKKEFTVDITLDEAITAAYGHYSKHETHLDWTVKNLATCITWANNTLALSNGIYNPLNRNILYPELYFDLTLPYSWANYSYVLPDGQTIEGKLAIKGTVDLITEIAPGFWEYIDWKTGKRINWATGEEKTWKKLRNDPQLLLYYYAIRKIFPEIKNVIMTIVYINDGGAFSMPYDDDDLIKCEKMLQKRFSLIQNTQTPFFNKSWRCNSFCYYKKTNFITPDGVDTGLPICDTLEGEIVQLGMQRVMAKHFSAKHSSEYGDGGGQSNRDTKILY